jgi:hypothetical protein
MVAAVRLTHPPDSPYKPADFARPPDARNPLRTDASTMPAPLPAGVCRRSAIRSLIGVACCALEGCTILKIDHKQSASKPVLPPLVAPKDALTLEVYYIERGAGDALIGESLWRQLDEAGAIKSQEVRSRLRTAGLRVGLAGTNPPQALRAAAAEQRSASERGPGAMRKVSLLAGQETTIEAAIIDDAFQVRTRGTAGERVTPYAGARCILRISGERQQDGWVRLHVHPELHHGAKTFRSSAQDGDWKLHQGQKIDQLYEQRFDVELSLGELVVLGPLGDEPDTIGARFFRTGEPPAASERVLVIRVADVQQIDPIRSNDW